MFQLSQQALDKLGSAALQQSLTDHWCRTHPAACGALSDGDLKHLVQQAIEAAEAKGITLERDLYTWCDLCIAARTAFAAGMGLQRDTPTHG